MTRKELVLKLHLNREKGFAVQILTGTPDLEMKWKLDKGVYYVFPGKVRGRSLSDEKAWGNSQKTGEYLILSSEDDCVYFCENYNTISDRPEPVEATTVE